jgi:hypothetical protein
MPASARGQSPKLGGKCAGHASQPGSRMGSAKTSPAETLHRDKAPTRPWTSLRTHKCP